MVKNCSVSNCREAGKPGSIYSFHKFPRDPKRRAAWIAALDREDFEPSINARVCSRHFTSDSFDAERNGFAYLKNTAVPTLFEPSEAKRLYVKSPAFSRKRKHIRAPVKLSPTLKKRGRKRKLPEDATPKTSDPPASGPKGKRRKLATDETPKGKRAKAIKEEIPSEDEKTTGEPLIQRISVIKSEASDDACHTVDETSESAQASKDKAGESTKMKTRGVRFNNRRYGVTAVGATKKAIRMPTFMKKKSSPKKSPKSGSAASRVDTKSAPFQSVFDDPEIIRNISEGKLSYIADPMLGSGISNLLIEKGYKCVILQPLHTKDRVKGSVGGSALKRQCDVALKSLERARTSKKNALLKIQELEKEIRKLKTGTPASEKNICNSEIKSLMTSLQGPALEILKRSCEQGRKEPLSPIIKDFASTLYNISPKAYNFVRDTFDCFLPHVRTVRDFRNYSKPPAQQDDSTAEVEHPDAEEGDTADEEKTDSADKEEGVDSADNGQMDSKGAAKDDSVTNNGEIDSDADEDSKTDDAKEANSSAIDDSPAIKKEIVE